MRDRQRHRQRRSGHALAYFAVALLLTVLLASCTVQWITPVPTSDTAQPVEESEEVATVEPDQVTPVPLPEEPAAEEAAEDPAEPADQEATDATEGAETTSAPGNQAGAQGDTSPASLSHALARHDDCVDCHAVDSRREPAPADHAGLTDDICLYCHMPEEGETAIPPLPTKAESDFCLGCHGPFEDLLVSTEGYIVDEDLIGNPHLPIPHDSNSPTSCSNCHDVHGLPVTAEVEIEEANLTYCFAACHHEQNFEPCSQCHEE